MKFRIDDYDYIEINTLAELQAFALGGEGVVKINFVEWNKLTGESFKTPRIIKCREEDNGY